VASHVALLRAVNVGGRGKLAMSDLRALLASLGYDDIRTHLQSGNAVFTTAATSPQRLEQEIERALAAQLGMTTRVLVRTRNELERIIADSPLLELADDHARLLVVFLSTAPDRELARELSPADFEPDVFAFGDRVIYTWHPHGVRTTKLSNAFLERRFGVVATGRNWRTVTRLAELLGEF
jgi:uncharacterized protein (DUF1697 family)